MCKNCDENFYSMEASCDSVLFKVYFGATQAEYEKNLPLLRQIKKKHKASVIAYDYLKEQVEIGYQVDPLGAYGSELIDMWNCTEDDFVKEILSLEAAPIVRDGITYFESEEEVDEPPMYVPMKQ